MSSSSHQNGKQRHASGGEVTSIDELVLSLGGCGPFQVGLVVATYSVQVCAVWGMLLMAFGIYHGNWWCPGGQEFESTTESALQLKSSGMNVQGRGDAMEALTDTKHNKLTYNSSFSVDNLKDYNVSTERSIVLNSCDDVKSCPNIQFDDPASTIVTEWMLVCDMEWVPSFIISIQMAGVLIGSYFGGFFGERFGRKISMYGCALAHAIFNFIAIFSVSWQMFTCIRFFIGMFLGGILATSFLYPMEFLNEYWRAIFGGIPIWNLGAATFSVLVFLLKDWRHLHIATAVMSIIVLLPVPWVPESLRWLAVHGKLDQAKRLSHRIARINKCPPPSTDILEKTAQEEKRKTTMQYSFLDLFLDPSFRKMSVVLGLVWATLSLVYYAISFGVKALSGDFYINFILISVLEILGMICVAPATHFLGRRLSSIVYFLVNGIICLCVVIVNFAAPENAKGTVINVLAMFVKINILPCWMIIVVFGTELYPTVTRNLSSGFLNACARIGGIAAPYLMPNNPKSLYVSFLVMGLLLLAGSGMLMTLRETKGTPLQDRMAKKFKLSVIPEETEQDLRDEEERSMV